MSKTKKQKSNKKKSNVGLTILILGLILLIAAVLSFIILNLINNNANDNKKYTTSFITSEVVKKMNYDNLSEITASNMSKYYDIPDGLVEDSSMYISTRADNFTEIACFRLRNEGDQEKLVKIINEYINDKKTTYSKVNDKAYAIAASGKTDIIYPYVFVAIASDSDAAVSAFESVIGVNSIEKKSTAKKTSP